MEQNFQARSISPRSGDLERFHDEIIKWHKQIFIKSIFHRFITKVFSIITSSLLEFHVLSFMTVGQLKVNLWIITIYCTVQPALFWDVIVTIQWFDGLPRKHAIVGVLVQVIGATGLFCIPLGTGKVTLGSRNQSKGQVSWIYIAGTIHS